MTLSSCGQTKIIAFPFEISDVEEVEVYRYTVPADAEKKTLTEQKDIEEIINHLSGITLKEEEIRELAGSTTTSFRFNLADGADYVIIYNSCAVKSGTIRLSDDETTWFTAADIGGFWQNCDVKAIQVDENELPMVE